MYGIIFVFDDGLLLGFILAGFGFVLAINHSNTFFYLILDLLLGNEEKWILPVNVKGIYLFNS